MRVGRIILTLISLYLISFLVIRMAWAEVWAQDGKIYVILPESPLALYYAFRPLSMLDESLTGMGTHIGPHQ
ncbi:hypothetical protein [Neogemmobacter tilapiae]|uniref:Uncharacterized protein n=1 Tax=Neogemmobacter tilapiae TaxID=875041 RepID=A0A918TF92_9RHOB|nr:hypothetical protein [Gemmobacter tilapiae]GHC46032.1 hypothetical protein GCM10007315_04570 [Gemmobacter tilapiae]